MQAGALDVLEEVLPQAGREERDPVRGGAIQVRRNCERDAVVEMKILPAGDEPPRSARSVYVSL